MERLDRIEKILEEVALSSEKYKLESEKEFRELRELQAKNEAKSEKEFRELRELQAKNEAKSEKEFRELRETQEKTNKQIEKTSLEVNKLTKQVKEITKSFNGFTKNQGSMVENLFYESLRDDMILDDVVYDDIFLNLEVQRKELGLNQEFDIILKNGSDIAIIETKSTPDLDDIKQLENIVNNYKIFFKEHKDYTIKGFLASLQKFNSHFKKQAHKKGFKLLNLKGNKIEVI